LLPISPTPRAAAAPPPGAFRRVFAFLRQRFRRHLSRRLPQRCFLIFSFAAAAAAGFAISTPSIAFFAVFGRQFSGWLLRHSAAATPKAEISH